MLTRKIISGLLTGTLCISLLAGCSGSTSSGDSSATESNSTAESGTATNSADTSADAAYNISFIVKLTDGHFSKVMAGANAYANEHDNVNVEIQSPSSATAYDEQVNMIETMLNSGAYDAMVLSPLQSESAAGLVANTQIPIIACDTDFTSDKKLAFVGTGNKDAAKSGGLATVQAAIDSGVEKPTAVILTGVQGDETHDARLEGYREGIEEAGGEVLEVQYCDALADKAASAMEAVMQKYPDGVDVVCSTNDDMVMAALKVKTDSNNPAYADCIMCGFDGNQVAIEAIQEGRLTMDVAQLGYDMGYKAMEAAVAALEGQSVDSFIDSGAEVVSSENVEDYISSMKEIGVWE